MLHFDQRTLKEQCICRFKPGILFRKGGVLMDDKTAQLAKILQESDNIVFFGGAGVSTASGIPDFRSSDGLVQSKARQEFHAGAACVHSFFHALSDDFFDFYKKNLVYPGCRAKRLSHRSCKAGGNGQVKSGHHAEY